jgi:hypothetical protein
VTLRFEEAAAMRASHALTAALLLLLSAPAGAAVFEIPLPELAGTYGPQGPNGRTATFHLPGIPAVIHGASLRVRGTTEVGILRCDPGGDYPWVTVTLGEMFAGPDQYWLSEATNPPVAGAFETITPFTFLSISHLPESWTFLADGEATIGFYGAPMGTVLDCIDLNPPSVTVTEATLIFDADIPVPTKVQSWGRIKAAYR